jgi:hypothetical protein
MTMKASVNAFVPYEKLSKKQKREIDRARRADWGTVNPVSRRVESAKVYNRKKRRSGREDCGTGAFLYGGEAAAGRITG